MALTVTNKLTNSTLDPQLVTILQALEHKIPEASHFTICKSMMHNKQGIVILTIGDESTEYETLLLGKPVIGMILLCEVTDLENSITFLLSNYLPEVRGYIHFCGTGGLEGVFTITSNGDAVGETLTILSSQMDRIQFSTGFLIGSTNP